MNSGSSYALKSARFLVIVCIVGNFLSSLYAGTRDTEVHKRFKVLPEDTDILLLRNQPHHIIEGMGAAGMLLGETEVELRQRYGEPAYRDLASPETLTYTEANFNASFIMRNGRITEIRLEIEKHKTPSFDFFTAQGLHETALRGKTAAEAAGVLARFYKTRRLRQVGESVDVYGRGIRFRFRGKTVIRVEVYKPAAYENDQELSR
jgi:hypothetical protein